MCPLSVLAWARVTASVFVTERAVRRGAAGVSRGGAAPRGPVRSIMSDVRPLPRDADVSPLAAGGAATGTVGAVAPAKDCHRLPLTIPPHITLQPVVHKCNEVDDARIE